MNNINQTGKGMLIVIEGLDGSGKSTQVKLLRNYLETHYGKVDYVHFPRYDAPVYGDLISTFLKGGFGEIDKVHPKLVALLYAEDRHAAAPDLKKRLGEGAIVLLDRYVYSNIAYQCAKVKDDAEREELRKWIADTEYKEFDLPVPDLNIFLDVPTGFVEAKLTSHREGADRDYLEGSRDIHEADIEFQKAVKSVYVRQTEVDPHFIRIDCSDEFGSMLPQEVIAEKINNAVDQVLK